MKKYLLIYSFFLLAACNHQAANFSLSDIWIGEPDSGFRDLKVVTGKKFMISSGNELASRAGSDIMVQGGNAIDAAIAAQLVLNIVEPQSSGIGGGAFILYYDKKSGETIYFNGRETAPKNSKSDMFLDKNGKPREFNDVVRGGLSVGTPGLLMAMAKAHKKYGKLPWEKLFQPAIKIANDGFIASNRFHILSSNISYLKDFGETAEIYLDKNGKAFKTGDKITNPKMVKTLKIISKEGIDPFYKGKIAHDIANVVQNSKINPGYLSLDDLKNYQIKTGDLLCDSYRKKYKICTMPLPAGGVTLLQIMGILENFDLSKFKPNSVEAIHLISEATRLAYADRNQYLADTADIPIHKMLDKDYLAKRAKLVDPNKAIEKIEPGKFTYKQNSVINNLVIELPSTTHLSVVDAAGNAVSMTSSIEYFFGSAISVDGFMLNNQLTDFSFEPIKNGNLVANRLEPKKQPRSSMSPTFVFDEKDKLIMIVGSPGGPRIIQFVVKTIINHLDFGLNAQESISIPTFVVLNNVIELEKNQDIIQLEPELKKMGHKTKVIEITSGIHAITIDKNKIEGGADPRREGVAVGF
jgi:gamma-glutamyltranspeptidase/glutathione hydrolase